LFLALLALSAAISCGKSSADDDDDGAAGTSGTNPSGSGGKAGSTSGGGGMPAAGRGGGGSGGQETGGQGGSTGGSSGAAGSAQGGATGGAGAASGAAGDGAGTSSAGAATGGDAGTDAGGGGDSGSSGSGGASGNASGGSAGEATTDWQEGEFRTCVMETAYTRARVYRYEAETSSCVTLLLEAPADACRQNFPVSGAWCLANATLAVDVDSCDDDTAAAQADSVTGTFSVTNERLLTTDVTIHFDDGGSVPAELSVELSRCRLLGCTADDCRVE
jgi:hypothetical protein